MAATYDYLRSRPEIVCAGFSQTGIANILAYEHKELKLQIDK